MSAGSMYVVAIRYADGTEAEKPKFFERLPDARAHAHRGVQSAEQAKIYETTLKPSLEAAFEVIDTHEPIEIIGRRATEKELRAFELERLWTMFPALRPK